MADSKKTTSDNPGDKVSPANDLKTQHEPGSIRDGSVANESMTPNDTVPDISGDPAGHAKAVGSEGETLDENNKDTETADRAAKEGQATAKKNTKEEGNIAKATGNETPEFDPGAEGQAAAKENIAAEKKQAKADGTLSPYL